MQRLLFTKRLLPSKNPTKLKAPFRELFLFQVISCALHLDCNNAFGVNGVVDAVLTYEELSNWLKEENIKLKQEMDDIEESELESEFGPSIAKLVKEVTKINKLSLSADSLYQINYYKKILVGLCEDVRVIIIKLADRLHNMKTLWAIPEEKQKEKAKETLEILAPIAHRLGIHYLKSELEDLSLRYYKPDVYYDIVTRLNNNKLERDNAVLEMKSNISLMLNEHSIKHEIKGRSKSIYSIYNKMQNGKKFEEIYDILALRVYVNTESECYLTLGLIHSISLYLKDLKIT